MGRQINYYMEADSFKLLAQKALDLGFVIVEQLSVKVENGLYYGKFKQYQSLSDMDFSVQCVQYYFHFEEAGEIVSSDGFIDIHQSPVVESSYSVIHENKITRGRIWISTGYYDDTDKFISRSDILDKKYSALARFVKKLTLYTEIPLKFPNGQIHAYKEYITPYLLDLIDTTQNECAQ